MSTTAQVLKALDIASQRSLVITAKVADTIVKPSIPIDIGVKSVVGGRKHGLREPTITKNSNGSVTLEHGKGLDYQAKQYFRKLQHVNSGGKMFSIISNVGVGKGFKTGAGHQALYGSAYRKAIKEKRMSRVAARWYEILKSDSSKRIMTKVFSNSLRRFL